MTEIAVLITCYNRKQRTLACIEKLKHQVPPVGTHCEIVLVDDGSSDGTGDAVHENFPEVVIVKGTGSLYWNRGMRLAWKTALKRRDYDYFLLLNDDTDLHDDAITTLLDTAILLRRTRRKPVIMVGSTADPLHGHRTYGGVTRRRNYIGIRFDPVEPSEDPRLCDTFNGNCVLVHKDIVADIGILSDKFSHAMGDTDYGLRARERGYECWVAPGYVGYCEENSLAGTWLDPGLKLRERRALLNDPKGSPPDEWLYFVKRHAGTVWLLAWVQLNLRLYFPRAWSLLRKSRGRKDRPFSSGLREQ